MKQVMIVPYDSIWQHLYIGEKKRVLQKLKNISGIHHIGSTAVPGMDARATIDIAVEVKRDIEALELAELGYYLICQEQRYKVYATKDHQFHLFVYNEADEELLKRIKLRDYFRTQVRGIVIVRSNGSLQEFILLISLPIKERATSS